MQNHLKSQERLNLTICNFLWNRVLDLNILKQLKLVIPGNKG